MVMAFPVVALPALVLPATAAVPVVAPSLTLLTIFCVSLRLAFAVTVFVVVFDASKLGENPGETKMSPLRLP